MKPPVTVRPYAIMPALSPAEVGLRIEQAVARSGLTHTAVADSIGLARPKIYEVIAGHKPARIEWLYRGAPQFVVELLRDIAAAHRLDVVTQPPPSSLDDPRDALRLVERLARACGDAVTRTAGVVADGQVDAAEGAELESLGEALIQQGHELKKLARRAKRERVVTLDEPTAQSRRFHGKPRSAP